MPDTISRSTVNALTSLLDSGDDRAFLERAVETLAAGLEVRWAGIARHLGHGRAEVVASWDTGKPGDKLVYGLKDTPCGEAAKGKGYCVFEDRVAELFPEDEHLKEMQAVSFHGQVFRDRSGQILGHVYALDDKATTAQAWQRDFVGLIAGWVGTEIERHCAEAAQRESERRLRAILDHAPMAIYLKDTEGRYLEINRRYEEMWGVRNEEVRGKLPGDVHRDEAFAATSRAHDMAILRRAEVIEQESEVHLADGLHVLRMTKFPIWNITGQITGLGAIAVDVTERKRTQEVLLASEQALKQRVADLEEAHCKLEVQGEALAVLAEDLRVARDEANAANRAKSEFLAAMGHELRTPLNTIIGFSEVIANETLGPAGNASYREYAKDILGSGNQLLALINDILELSKVESGSYALHEEKIDIPEVVQAVITVIGQRAQQAGIDLDLDIPDRPPLLFADPLKLKQILSHLLSNAVKFTSPGGRATLRIWCQMDSGYLFQIIDTGIGIAPEDVPKALSRFGQVDGDLNRQYEGSGLGLPLAKAFVELHGGVLDLQSEVNAGTTITARFPANRIVASRDEPDLLNLAVRTAS